MLFDNLNFHKVILKNFGKNLITKKSSWFQYVPGSMFPTGVGMNRQEGTNFIKIGYVPHRRGDEPFYNWV